MTREATAEFRAARDLLLARRGDPEAARAEFQWPRPARFNWALDHFDVAAGEHPDRAALHIVTDSSADVLSYGELSERSDRVANWLRGAGVRRGDPILVMLGNRVELWELTLAAMKLGATLIPSTTLLTRDAAADRVARGGVRHVVAEGDATALFADVPGDYTRVLVGAATHGWLDYTESASAPSGFTPDGDTAADDPLFLYFTSGTTSRPKLVEHSYLSYPVGHLSTMYWIGLRPGDVHLNVSSPGWAKHAWSSVFAPWNAQATILVYAYERFDPVRAVQVLRDCRVSTLCAPPTVWRLLIQSELGARPDALREAVSAGEPLNPEVIERVRAQWGVTVRDGFGQTETTAAVGNPPDAPVQPGSMGRPLPGYRVTLVDPVSGQPAAPDAEGEICLELEPRPVGLMTGYRGDAQLTAGSAQGGRYHTGDVATADAEGALTFIGRTDDVFKSSDYRISPFELESVLVEHPAVAEAAVVPSPDPLRLAVPKAYVTPAAGWAADKATALAVLLHARERLSPYQRVRRLEFAELPKTISGKIRRVELREREQQLRGAGQVPAGEWSEENLPELRG